MRITNEDLSILAQPCLEAYIKIEVYEESNLSTPIGEIDGLVSGTETISADSDVRRTFNITVTPSQKSMSQMKVDQNGLIWINRVVKLSIGLYSKRQKDYIWYKQGLYVFVNSSATYDATTNQISLNCSDLMAKLDGTKNGQLGALATIFPAYKENEETGEIIEYYYIRDAVITVLKQLAKITDYNIDDIGEFYAMPQYNADYEKYREENPQWNTIPYDQEFSCGCSILSILTTFRDLYPNYEMFFNEDGTFVCQMIPSCDYDDVTLDDSFFRKYFISENTSADLSVVRNICEVWGKVIETDFYTEVCTLIDGVYTCTVDGYEEKYYNGDLIAVKIPDTNPENCKLNVNEFGAIDICSETADGIVETESLEANTVYVFKITKKRVDGEDVTKACLLGHWQAHGLNVLVNGTTSTETYITSAGNEVPKYSKEYFQDVYGCESVEFTTISDSPFTVQKIGEILDVKTGGEYENITSDSLALARAEYENWKNCRLTDSITITTILCPFADVNIKVSYRQSDSTETHQYIVKSISHDFTGSTTTWTMMRFYPLYSDNIKGTSTHKTLSNYTHGTLSNYTHEQL